MNQIITAILTSVIINIFFIRILIRILSRKIDVFFETEEKIRNDFYKSIKDIFH